MQEADIVHTDDLRAGQLLLLPLVLFHNPGASERLNHLGIEAPTSQQVSAALARFTEAGLETRVTEQDMCCHAAQHKVFVTAPDVPLGWWEVLHRPRRQPGQPRRGVELGLRSGMQHRGHRAGHLLHLILAPAGRWPICQDAPVTARPVQPQPQPPAQPGARS